MVVCGFSNVYICKDNGIDLTCGYSASLLSKYLINSLAICLELLIGVHNESENGETTHITRGNPIMKFSCKIASKRRHCRRIDWRVLFTGPFNKIIRSRLDSRNECS